MHTFEEAIKLGYRIGRAFVRKIQMTLKDNFTQEYWNLKLRRIDLGLLIPFGEQS